MHRSCPILPYTRPFSPAPYHPRLGPATFHRLACPTMPDKTSSPSAPATTSNTSDRQHTQPQPADDDRSQQPDVESPEPSGAQREQVEEEAAAEADDESDDEEPEVGHDCLTVFVPRVGSV